MTLLHQAAQKAVEALELARSCVLASSEHAIGNPSFERAGSLCAEAVAALQQQPEPVALAEIDRDTDGELLIDWSPSPGRMVTLSLRDDGRLSYAITWDAERAHGTAQMPALQHQEEPREPVAKDVRVSDFIAGAAWHMANPDESLDALQEAAEWWATEHASPSTTRQQEVGSGFWWCAQCQCEVPSRSVTYEETHDVRAGGCGHPVGDCPAAPSTPEKAGGVSDGVGGNDA